MAPKYALAQIVRLTADQSRTGPVIEVLPPAGGEHRYRVFHGDNQIGEYFEEQLQPADAPRGSDRFIDAMVAGAWQGDDFRARFAAARLQHPETDGLYALRAARIKFIPFQFKPVLRFLRSDRPRLLIADDVGVGKTIEAGLILKELQTRQSLESALVVCPKALTTKWRAEMRRFDEDFHVLDSHTLRYCIDETHLEGVWPEKYSRAIVHLELLRMNEYLYGTHGRHGKPGLLTLDEPPQFGLVILDEAHHVRNPGTSSNEVGRFLSEISEAMVLLSATPVQTSSADLFHLLQILRPDQFRTLDVFHEMTEPNRHLTAAMRCLRYRESPDTWRDDAMDALDRAAATSWGSRSLIADPRFEAARHALSVDGPADDRQRVRLLRDLEEVHTFSTVMNRTRRRDIGRFTIREPKAVQVDFTLEQRRLYDELVAFRFGIAQRSHGSQVARLIIDTIERQAASCLHALVPSIDDLIARGVGGMNTITDDPDEADPASPGSTPVDDIELVDSATRLRALAASLPPEDPKADRLLAIIEESMTVGRPGKTLVFSFFLHTLGHLDRTLRQRGCRVALLTGQVPDEEREDLRDRFRLDRSHPDAIDVLLSSEVGCEGLDYEFCDQLVNYDLPWNPMRVEQRIGRIDRYGQKSEKVLIFNFVTPGTVEERVFFRAFDRLGVFRDVVGETEEVLGELATELTRAALDPRLTPEQQELRARQLADNQLRLVEEQSRLEEQGHQLIGLDDVFAADVDNVVVAERFVSPAELVQLVSTYLRSLAPGTTLSVAQGPTTWSLRVPSSAKAAIRTALRGVDRRGRADVTFTKWLDSDIPDLEVTFDQDTALEHRSLPFITPVHPLARIAVAAVSRDERPTIAHLTLTHPSAPPGRYLFVCEQWESIGVRRGIRLVTATVDLLRMCATDNLNALLPHLFSEATSSPSPAPLSATTLRAAGEIADNDLHRRRQLELADLRADNEIIVTQRLASLDAFHDAHLAAIDDRLRIDSSEKIQRMKRAERDRAIAAHREQQAALERSRQVDVIAERIAAGILEVHHAN